MKYVDVVVIGGGSAGMQAALSAKEHGVQDIMMLERCEEFGGILQQCIHNGFGLQMFKEELSGPMYAQRYIDQIQENNIDVRLYTTVLEIREDCKVLYVNEEEGYVWVQAKAIILATGCFERNRGAIQIPGKRLPGVYTAGSAQRFLNIENILVGKRIFILGSGDIGLIMARRMTLEGANVVGVAELMPYSNGLKRNLVQCLQDFDIPLYLSHTVVDIQGDRHVERVSIAQVDEQKQVILGTEKVFEVDTLLLSIGLLPENDLGRRIGMEMDVKTKGAIVNEYLQTSIPHIYACGNALHVHDIVDYVSMEAKQAGEHVANDVLHNIRGYEYVATVCKEGISYVIPQRISKDVKNTCTLCFRVKQPMKHVDIVVREGTRVIKTVTKRYVLPAEMERIEIAQEDFGHLKEDIIVEVVQK